MKRRVLSKEEIEQFKKDFYTTDTAALSEKYGLRSHSLYYLGKKLGLSRLEFNRKYMSVKSRKYSLDESYFQRIDNHEKAYFLGLMYADGYVQEKRNFVSLALSECDIETVRALKEAMSFDGPIHIYERKGGVRHPMCTVSFSSPKLTHSLVSNGCVGRKTFKIRFPFFLDDALYPSFVRGYFDGDGSVFVCKRMIRARGRKYIASDYGVGITSNSNFIHDLHGILVGMFGRTGIAVAVDKRKDGISNINIRGKAIFAFMDWIYSHDGTMMERKHALYSRLKQARANGLRGEDLVRFCKGEDR
jgi:hypothetical protein